MSPPSSFFPPTPCTFKRRVQATPHLPWLRVCATVTCHVCVLVLLFTGECPARVVADCVSPPTHHWCLAHVTTCLCSPSLARFLSLLSYLARALSLSHTLRPTARACSVVTSATSARTRRKAGDDAGSAGGHGAERTQHHGPQSKPTRLVQAAATARVPRKACSRL